MIIIAGEKNFENKLKDFLDEQGCYWIKTHGDRFSKVGTPDLLINCNGFFIGCEVKAENGKPSKLQLYHLDQIEKAGGFGFISIPTAGVNKVRNYIQNEFPEYSHTKIYDLEKFKKLILFLKGYEAINQDVVY